MELRKMFEPIRIGNVQLKNRVMFPPMTTGYENADGLPSEKCIAFYEELAQGEVGYIVLGDVAPVPTMTPTPKLFNDDLISGFRPLADAVHRHGACLGMQIFYPEYDVPEVGRLILHARMQTEEAAKAEATRAAYAKMHYDMQHFASEATTLQIEQIQQVMTDCAIRAVKAGADIIELHGDRLLGSFLSELINKRTDNYGGTLENRCRFSTELIRKIKQALPGTPIEYKLPVITTNEDGTLRGKGGVQVEEAPQAALLLQQAGADALQVAQANHTGNLADTIPPRGAVPHCWTLSVAHQVKQVVTIPVATVGWIHTPERGEQILQEGQADIVAYGRPFLADPEMLKKALHNEPFTLCIGCNAACVGGLLKRRPVACVVRKK